MLLVPDQREVAGDQGQDDAREQQHVSDVEARNDEVAGEVAVEDQPVHPGTDDRDTHRDTTEGGAEAGAREQVVGDGVTEEAFEHRQDEQQAADDPVRFTRATEGAGEEDASEVNDDRRREHQCSPVVNLANEETAAHLEGDVQGRLVGARHRDTAKRLVRALVDDVCHRRIEEQRQEHTGDQQDHEAVERDLAEHEGPVRREDLVDLPAHACGEVVAGVHSLRLSSRCRADLGRFGCCCGHGRRSQNAGPSASMKSPSATRKPSSFTVIGNCGSARAAGPKIGLP